MSPNLAKRLLLSSAAVLFGFGVLAAPLTFSPDDGSLIVKAAHADKNGGGNGNGGGGKSGGNGSGGSGGGSGSSGQGSGGDGNSDGGTSGSDGANSGSDSANSGPGSKSSGSSANAHSSSDDDGGNDDVGDDDGDDHDIGDDHGDDGGDDDIGDDDGDDHDIGDDQGDDGDDDGDDDSADDSDSADASELGGLNAAHALANGSPNAAPNSRVGHIANYESAVLDGDIQAAQDAASAAANRTLTDDVLHELNEILGIDDTAVGDDGTTVHDLEPDVSSQTEDQAKDA